jgi:hypothetical protein
MLEKCKSQTLHPVGNSISKAVALLARPARARQTHWFYWCAEGGENGDDGYGKPWAYFT